MHSKLKFAAWLAALYGGLLATVAATVLLVEGGISPEGLTFVAALLLALCGVVVAWFFRRFVTAPRALAAEISIFRNCGCESRRNPRRRRRSRTGSTRTN